MVKNQEKFYERILTERTRHTEEVGDLKEDAEKKTKEIKAEMDTRFEKFIKENQNKPASDDFINKMKEYKKMQTEFLDMTFDTLEARGFDRKSLDEMRKVTNTKAKEQESGIGKIYDVGKLIWKNYIEPAADKASKELNAAPSGLDNRVSPEIEKRIREETDAKARQIEAENKVLQLQLEEEKKRIYTLQEERKQLEYRASELMIPYDDTVPNDHLFYMIEQQEAVIEQQNAAMKREMEREKRAELARRARSTMLHEVAVPEVAIPDTEAEIDERYEASPQEPTKADEAPDVQRDAQNNQIPRPNIHEELSIPRETSQETMDFMNEIGGTEGELMVKPEPEPESEMEEKPLEEEPEQPKKEKEHHTKAKRKTRPNSKFTVYKDDGTEIAKVESTNHKNAGLKIANQLNGAICIILFRFPGFIRNAYPDGAVWSAEITNKKGTKYNVPRVKVV